MKSKKEQSEYTKKNGQWRILISQDQRSIVSSAMQEIGADDPRTAISYIVADWYRIKSQQVAA